MSLRRQVRKLSIVVPVYDEQDAVAPFLRRARPSVEEALGLMGEGAMAEWLFVNDGSQDATRVVITEIASREPGVKLLNLSRNFGKEAAIAAGIDHASGDAVIPIDVDLQDPPEVIPRLVERWLDGAQVVNAKRANRDADGRAKRLTARWFYRLYNRLAEHEIPENVGDFRLLDHEAVAVLRRLPEQSRFNKGLFSWIGFRVETLEYSREARGSGESKWPARRLWRLALDGITSSTTAPLRIWSYVGVVVALLAIGYAAFLVVYTLAFGADAPGYASIMVAVLGLGALNLLSMGVLGEYVGRIAVEVRRRPLYVVESRVGF